MGQYPIRIVKTAATKRNKIYVGFMYQNRRKLWLLPQVKESTGMFKKESCGMPKQRGRMLLVAATAVALVTVTPATIRSAENGSLRVHNVFGSNMVIQRDKPITVWGWAETGQKVLVRFGTAKAESTADKREGRWEVTFSARQANATGQKLKVTSGDAIIEMDNILIGDVWVMNGQSNMAFGLAKTYRADMETTAANLPLLRRIGILPNESYVLQKDLPADRVEGWTVCTPETAGRFSSIGYIFASRLQRALQIPIGIIDNARGGASIESLVPRHKFDDHPLAARYLAWVEKRRVEFDWDAAMSKLVDKWEKTVAQQRKKGVPEDELPPRPTRRNLRSWNVPGAAPATPLPATMACSVSAKA